MVAGGDGCPACLFEDFGALAAMCAGTDVGFGAHPVDHVRVMQLERRTLGTDNRLVGLLHGCLRHRTKYDEHIAWAHRTEQQPTAA